MLAAEDALQQKKEKRLLTASRLRVARACRRLHYFMYELGIRPVEDVEVLRFGTAFHRVLEVWWKGWQLPEEERLRVAIAACAATDPFELARLRVLVMAYHLRWQDEPYRPLAVEAKFETPLRNPLTGATSRTWVLGGKVDVVVQHTGTGAVYLMEHKTASDDLSPGSNYFKKLRIDGQVSVYFEGGTSLGYDIAGCIYDVIGKPKQRQLEATPLESRKYKKDGTLYAAQRDRDETPEEYEQRIVQVVAEDPSRFLARVEVVRLEAEMIDAMADVWQLGQELRESELAGRRPRNPDNCVLPYRTCPFFGVCTGEQSLEDPRLFLRSSNVHPELSEAPEEGAAQ